MPPKEFPPLTKELLPPLKELPPPLVSREEKEDADTSPVTGGVVNMLGTSPSSRPELLPSMFYIRNRAQGCIETHCVNILSVFLKYYYVCKYHGHVETSCVNLGVPRDPLEDLLTRLMNA